MQFFQNFKEVYHLCIDVNDMTLSQAKFLKRCSRLSNPSEKPKEMLKRDNQTCCTKQAINRHIPYE